MRHSNGGKGDDRRPGTGYDTGWDRIFGPKKVDAPLTRCAAHQDGDCSHKECPQLRDNEPAATGRNCPLWTDPEES